jgi:ribosomal protein S18 acetylase RimI-like enzyme
VPGAASSFVVRQGQEAAGYLLVLPEESEVQSGERVAHVYDMVVLPKFRGSPIARKMMERVLDVALTGTPILRQLFHTL